MMIRRWWWFDDGDDGDDGDNGNDNRGEHDDDDSDNDNDNRDEHDDEDDNEDADGNHLFHYISLYLTQISLYRTLSLLILLYLTASN